MLTAPLIQTKMSRNGLFMDWVNEEVLLPLEISQNDVLEILANLCKVQLEQLSHEFDEKDNA